MVAPSPGDGGRGTMSAEVVPVRIESSVTALSWIPSEAVRGLARAAFDVGVTHYDEPPPDQIDDLEALRDADRFRFANNLRAWIDVQDGRIVDFGYSGGGVIGSTTVRMGKLAATFAGYPLPDIQRDPEVGDTWVRFVQTGGGKTGLPAPRRVRRKPFVQWRAPTAWSTLALTIHADGTTEWEVVGASPFPRHWVYDHSGALVGKSGLTEYKDWWRKAFGKHTPWGDEESPALVTAAETALERQMSTTIMRGGKRPSFRKLREGQTLVEQGEESDELFLVVDGVVRIEKDGERLAEYGPGALLGERAALEGGTRTSSIVAVTACRVAVAAADQLDRDALVEVSRGHRREEQHST
jgi:hypothetical protein